MKYREIFKNLIIKANTREDIKNILDAFHKKNIDFGKEVGEDYVRTAIRKLTSLPRINE
jgi:hypothetical protein